MKKFNCFTYFAKPSKAALRTFEDGAFFNILKYIVKTTFITSVKFFCLLSLFSSALVSSNSFSTSSNFFDRWKHNFDLNIVNLNHADHTFKKWSNNLKQGFSTSGGTRNATLLLLPHPHVYLPKMGKRDTQNINFFKKVAGFKTLKNH